MANPVLVEVACQLATKISNQSTMDWLTSVWYQIWLAKQSEEISELRGLPIPASLVICNELYDRVLAPLDVSRIRLESIEWSDTFESEFLNYSTNLMQHTIRSTNYFYQSCLFVMAFSSLLLGGKNVVSNNPALADFYLELLDHHIQLIFNGFSNQPKYILVVNQLSYLRHRIAELSAAEPTTPFSG